MARKSDYAFMKDGLKSVIDGGVEKTQNFQALRSLVKSLRDWGFSRKEACHLASCVKLEVPELNDETTELLDLFAGVVAKTYKAMRKDFGKKTARRMLPNIVRQMQFAVEA